MKIKNLLANVVAILTVITLIGGFQINAAEQVTTVTETVIGVDEAYAGPCGDRGCDGENRNICTFYTVLEIGDTVWIRKCRGDMHEVEEDQLGGSTPTVETNSI